MRDITFNTGDDFGYSKLCIDHVELRAMDDGTVQLLSLTLSLGTRTVVLKPRHLCSVASTVARIESAFQ
jgi:hypothetical protein